MVLSQNVTWETTPFNPPFFPLSVKSPYTSAWTAGGSSEPGKRWPYFGTGGTLGWACYVKVDNATYNVLGTIVASNTTVQTRTEFTATRTIISSRAGPVDIVVTFLSAIDVNDLVRLSLPFSYFSVSVAANDGASHAISVYTDISGEFVTGDTTQTVEWSTTTGNIVLHKMYLQQPIVYNERQQRAQWGAMYLAANQTQGTSWQTGSADALRGLFIKSGVLANTQDSNFRQVGKDWPVLAIAQDLGAVATQAQVATFVLGHSRNPAVQYYTNSGTQERSLYFLSKFSSEEDAIRYSVSDYDNARTASVEFDNRVQTDAARYSPDYASVVAFATRQAFASIEITLSGTGTAADLQDIKLFTKDAAVDNTGASREGVFSSVDSLYSIMPMLIYTNPNLGNYALASFFEYPETRAQSYAPHDLGLRYSRVVAHERQYRNPVDGELCSTMLYAIADRRTMRAAATANMIIMTYAFMRYTGDAKLAAKHYYTLKAWADYLVKNALVHSDQLTGDWFMTTGVSNQTNLALKGLIALKVAELNEDGQDAAKSGLEQWMELSNSGTKFRYESNSEQPQLLHGLYADKILGLNFVPESVYAIQRTQWTSGMSTFTKLFGGKLLTSFSEKFGVPLGDQGTTTSLAWEYFTLAALSTSDTNFLSNSSLTPLKSLAAMMQGDSEVIAPADVYDVITGQAIQGYSLRGNIGGSYALLALK
ncbi:hypothetical protein RHS04_01442 [Rhizoctonia solani]|uniref:Glutaminase GtaA n=1 Tax=Rhizoctonia solani TaxID=456999 RepID=A0A8H7HF82_9AGAM|nr:hypothetical protein RHS04_01442 [Rhizoctonia solani]